MEKSRVYALIKNGIVTRLEGEYTLPEDLDEWTLIEEGAPCDRLNLAQTHYLPLPLKDEHGIYRYRIVEVEDVDKFETHIGWHDEIVERPKFDREMEYIRNSKSKYSETIKITREDFNLLDVEDEVIYNILEEDGTITVKMGVNE